MSSLSARLRAALGATPNEPFPTIPADVTIELGCGRSKLRPDSTGIDALAFPGVDIVGALPAALADVRSSSVDIVFSHHFLEHLDDIDELMAECRRILRPAGTFIAVVPHFSNPYYYSDPTHRLQFGLYSMSYHAADAIHRRQLDEYAVDSEPHFRLVEVRYSFKTSVRRPLEFVVARPLELAVNRWVRFREFYERRLVWLWPCAELRFVLERTSAPTPNEPTEAP